MLKGRILNKKTSTIGIVAPSSYEEESIINDKITSLSSLGFNLKLGKHIYNRSSFFAGTDKERAEDIMDMFLDSSVDGILCLRGGYGSIRIIPYIDTNIILDNPKFFCGFSDITILLNYFSSLGLITFHGPMVNSNFNDLITYNSFLNISGYNLKNYIYNLNNYPAISYYNEKSFSGIIKGGNLSVICSSIGTPWEINTENSILLLEEINEPSYRIDRMITQLINCGLITKCNGIIIGYLSNKNNYNNSKEKKELENTVLEVLMPLNIPFIIGFPFGHNYPNLTIPIGTTASFSNNNKTLTICDNFLN